MNWKIRSDDGKQAVLDIGDWGGLVLRGGYEAPPAVPGADTGVDLPRHQWRFAADLGAFLVALQGIDAVFHLAALSNDPLGSLAPEITYDINHHASVTLAAAAKVWPYTPIGTLVTIEE